MKKTTLLAIVTISFIAGTIASSTLAVADTNTQGQPFQALQAAIQSLQTQLSSLQTQVNNIQSTPGPQGPAGATGAQGPQGPAGPAGATTNFYIRGANFPMPPHSDFQFPPLSVQCFLPGDKIISGGYDNPLQLPITGSLPNSLSSPQEWDVRVTNPNDFSSSVTVFAVCAH